MSFFRPPKTKPRQYNYIPRYYDPVKEERDRRRRELHGTSALDDEPYTPGKYIRTQREARDASSGERSSFAGFGRFFFLAVILTVAMLVLYPRFMRFVNHAAEEKEYATAVAAGATAESDTTTVSRIVLYEKHGDIDFREFESLTPETINEMEEWQNSVGRINIYDDDVEIVDGKRVDAKHSNVSK
ncbi:MAG: hypothetical protein IJ464_03425 [Alistipes sp.]|nr:hypothetical protein [Alistipes sp.]